MSMHTRSIKLIIESNIDHIPLLSKAVRSVCSTVIQDEVLLYNLELCLVEAVTNVIEHAYHQKLGNLVEVIVTFDENDIVFHVIDLGDKGVIPIPKKELDYNPKDVSSLPESGMGLFLIHRIMDEVHLSKKGKKNVLLMKKYVNQTGN